MPGRLWRFDIERESTGCVLILSISGRIGGAAAPALREALTDAAGAGAPLVVDLTRVDYISGAGVAALQAAAAARDGAFVLCGISPPVRVALDLAGASSGIAIEPTCQEAVARAERTPGLR